MLEDIIVFFSSNTMAFVAAVGIIGLLIGSFLNVCIYRIPQTLLQHWRKDCYEFLTINEAVNTRNIFVALMFPGSACPSCQQPVKFYDNIPLISYALLGGSCRSCKQNISLRYPIVEFISSILCIIIAYNFGFSWQTVAGCIFTWTLMVQAFIDLDHTFIPDEITLPMIWLGLLINLQTTFVDIHSSIIGAVVGYISLWSVYWIFYWITKKEGMGHGDFKLLAMIGAWLGWQVLPFVVLCSSLIGSIVGVTLLIVTKKDRNTQIPFGPYLAIAGWLALVWGSDINAWYLSTAWGVF